MGRSPESLYYHVKALVAVGIVVEDDTRRVGRRTETVYRLSAPRIRIDAGKRTRRYTEAMARACSSLLRVAERHYRSALARGGFTLDGESRDLAARQYNLRLDRKGLAEVNALIDRLTKLKTGQEEATSGDVYAVTLVLSKRTQS